MRRAIYLALLLLTTRFAGAQFKNDNVLFTLVDPSDLCVTLDKNPGYLLLDVRSKGEHHDTSSFAGYNYGRFKNAKNIDIRELGSRLSELKDHKDKPIFVYCSHSQRSRRAGKMLADSGFTKVFNVNGGMTMVHYTSNLARSCLDDLIETNIDYNYVSAKELCEKLKQKDRPFYVLDVRPDSAFRHISLDAKSNGLGHIKGAVNIPLAELKDKLAMVPKSRMEIVITDLYGDQSALAAAVLRSQGYENVSVLVEGIDRLLLTDSEEIPCKEEMYVPATPYKLINVTEFGKMAAANKNLVIVDLRSREEYENKHKDTWRNIGHIRKAIHIPATELNDRINELKKNKEKEIVLYAFGASPEVFTAANTLYQAGYTRVHVMTGGIFNLRWTAANKKGQSALKDLVEDIPEVNQ